MSAFDGEQHRRSYLDPHAGLGAFFVTLLALLAVAAVAAFLLLHGAGLWVWGTARELGGKGGKGASG